MRSWFKIWLTICIDRYTVVRNVMDGGIVMQSVTVSPKYQVVIPRPVRNNLNLMPGQKMQVLEYKGRVELIPEKDISDLLGFVKGINTKFKREGDRV